MLKGRERKDPDRGGVAKLVGGAVILLGVLFAALILMGARPAAAQGLADFDYENLSIRGAALDVGYIFPTRVEPTATFGGRMDLGFLGPGVRVTAGFHRWSSSLKRSEVGKLESQVEELIFEQTGDSVAVDLGRISWSDFALHGDVHFLWRIPMGLFTYAGAGATAHVLRGSGPAIDDTFVEDLLDSVRAGINIHGGVEFPLSARIRLVGETRWELLENLSYVQVRAGGQIMLGAWGQGGAGR